VGGLLAVFGLIDWLAIPGGTRAEKYGAVARRRKRTYERENFHREYRDRNETFPHATAVIQGPDGYSSTTTS
jgi:hypothetical protein